MLNWVQREARADYIMLILVNLFGVLIVNMLGGICVPSESNS